MIHLILAAALAVAPATAPAPAQEHAGHHEGMKHDGPCCPKDGKPMDCCKGKKMPCCEEKKVAGQAPAATEGHGAHEHDH
jgi:hypothetical protein